jgi:hypothetical protein
MGWAQHNYPPAAKPDSFNFMISTKDLSLLPDRIKLQQLCRSISVIDAILSEDWHDRLYLYNSKWSKDEEYFEMNNRQGDSLHILFRKDGCVINGMSHEFYPKNKKELTRGLPKKFEDFIFGEPMHSTGTTLCIWTNEENKWQTGVLENFDDNSEETLSVLDGNPQTYIDGAIEYYEDAFSPNEETIKAISEIYQGKILTRSMVLSINKDIKHWKQLREDLAEINYPNNLRSWKFW